MRSPERVERKDQKRTPLFLFCRGARKSGEKALDSGIPPPLVFVTSPCAQTVLTGQVKLKGNWRGLRPPLLSSPTTKELVPNTGVETLPKVQGPGETTAWKCFRQTRKKVRQPGSHGSPLASTPRSLTNSCSCSWKTPEPAARYCTGTRGGGRGAVSSADARSAVGGGEGGAGRYLLTKCHQQQ